MYPSQLELTKTGEGAETIAQSQRAVRPRQSWIASVLRTDYIHLIETS